ncbi:tripartite motif containing 101 isoform X2 [Hypomesus transpacificus]|uniref:tripartite motif containing 101 isoform X2 n=1 Tax=Hypomesus transpacificus TaxID=137520 RepID=UPI001F087F33|nr:tripartite motif containing 101 isoform X2 [Hypomesus transpacificus]XP_046895476.1 tripartite motif containing 101 isoform X2 [Hypomesus transpacificus]
MSLSVPLELSSLQRDHQALDTLEKQLICPICLEVFTKPVVILPCQHNLCRKCANDLYQPSLFQTRSNMVGRFRCPSCRQEVVLDRHGVYGLQRNLLVENIIDAYKQEATSLRPPPKSSDHVTCQEHEGERVNIFCLSCQKPTCSLCKVFGAHKACRVAPLPEVYQQQKSELTDGISSLVSVNSRVQASINELEETCRNIEENCKTQKRALCDKFDRMYAILEQRRNIMTQRISYEQEEKMGFTQELVRSNGENVEANTKLVETALRTMEEPEMAAFVQSSRALIEKVLEATKSTTIQTLEPGYENMDHYKVDFNAEERTLYQLDFEVEEVVPEEPEPEPEPELEQVIEPLPVPEPVLESVSVLEPAPVWVPVSSLVLSPEEAEVRLKSKEWSLKDPVADYIEEEEEEKIEEEEEEEEKVRGQAEGCVADPYKEDLCEADGMNIQQTEPAWGQQGEPDSGAWAAQGMAMCGAREEETRFYPSWYSPNGWHRLSPSPAVKTKPLAVPDNTPQLNKGPLPQPPFQPQPQTLSLPQYQPLQLQPQQLSLPQQPPLIPTPRWLEASFAGGLGSTSTGGHQGCVSQTGAEGDSPGLGVSVTQAREGGPGLEESAVGRLGSGPSTPQQAVTLFFYLVVLLVILQRVWACISCFICI